MTTNHGQDPSETLDGIGARMYRGRNDDLTSRAARIYGGTAEAVYQTTSREPEVPQRRGAARPGETLPEDVTDLDDIAARMFRR